MNEAAVMDERPLCAVTMLRDDYAFLEKWIAHYERLCGGRDALFIVAHGENPEINEIAEGCSVITVPHFRNGSQFEPRRRRLFNGLVEGLRAYYQFVLTIDIDEFIVLDPEAGDDLSKYLAKARFDAPALSPVGFDIVHKPSVEDQPFDFDIPATLQRTHGYIDGTYSKPCLFERRPEAGGTAHFLNDAPWQIDPNIFLFHLKHFDENISLEIANKRKATVLGYEERARTHRIRGWHTADEDLSKAISAVEKDAVEELSTEATLDAIDLLRGEFEEEERFPWGRCRFGPFTIPPRFQGLV